MKEESNDLNQSLPILNADHELHLKELFHAYSNLSTATGSRSNLSGSTTALQDIYDDDDDDDDDE